MSIFDGLDTKKHSIFDEMGDKGSIFDGLGSVGETAKSTALTMGRPIGNVLGKILQIIGAPQRGVIQGLNLLGDEDKSNAASRIAGAIMGSPYEGESQLLNKIVPNLDTESFGGKLAQFGTSIATDPLILLGGPISKLKAGEKLLAGAGQGLRAAESISPLIEGGVNAVGKTFNRGYLVKKYLPELWPCSRSMRSWKVLLE